MADTTAAAACIVLAAFGVVVDTEFSIEVLGRKNAVRVLALSVGHARWLGLG